MVIYKEITLHRTFHLGGPKSDSSSTHTAPLLSTAAPLPREQGFGVGPAPMAAIAPHNPELGVLSSCCHCPGRGTRFPQGPQSTPMGTQGYAAHPSPGRGTRNRLHYHRGARRVPWKEKAPRDPALGCAFSVLPG